MVHFLHFVILLYRFPLREHFLCNCSEDSRTEKQIIPIKHWLQGCSFQQKILDFGKLLILQDLGNMQKDKKKKNLPKRKKANSCGASYIGKMKLYLPIHKSTFCNIICHHRSDLDSDSEILWIEINIMGTKPILVGSFCNCRVSLKKNQSVQI